MDCTCTPVAYVPPVNIPGPAGVDGTPGTPGAAGASAYTFTTNTVAFTGTPTALVANSSAFAVGQIVFISDGTNSAYYSITTVAVGSLVLSALTAYPTTGVTPCAIGSKVTVSGPIGPTGATNVLQTDVATGGSQYLLVSPGAQVLSKSVTLSATHTYSISARCFFTYVGATYGTTAPTITMLLYRSTPSAAIVSNSAVTIIGRIVATKTEGVGEASIIGFPYTAIGSDIIQVYAYVSALPDNSNPGTVDVRVVECRISALLLT